MWDMLLIRLRRGNLPSPILGKVDLTKVDEASVDTHFMIAERETQGTPTAARSPQTGDNVDAALWALLLVLPALLMAFAVQIRKQKLRWRHSKRIKNNIYPMFDFCLRNVNLYQMLKDYGGLITC